MTTMVKAFATVGKKRVSPTFEALEIGNGIVETFSPIKEIIVKAIRRPYAFQLFLQVWMGRIGTEIEIPSTALGIHPHFDGNGL